MHLLFRIDDEPVPVSFHHNGYLLVGSEKSVNLFEENYKTQMYEVVAQNSIRTMDCLDPWERSYSF